MCNIAAVKLVPYQHNRRTQVECIVWEEGDTKRQKFSICLIKHFHEDVWGSGCTVPPILDLGTRWRWLISFTVRLLYPRGNSPYRTHWKGGRVGPRASLDAVNRNISCPCLESNPGRPADHMPSLYWLSHPGSLRMECFDTAGRESESYITTDAQPASLSWNKAPIWCLRPDLYYCQTVAGLLMWGVLSDKRTGLSFTIVAGHRKRSHSRVRVPWDSRPYFTVSDSRLAFSSSPKNRRATVEVFDPASMREEKVIWGEDNHITSRLIKRTVH
jgi:hypothetical protein